MNAIAFFESEADAAAVKAAKQLVKDGAAEWLYDSTSAGLVAKGTNSAYVVVFKVDGAYVDFSLSDDFYQIAYVEAQQ